MNNLDRKVQLAAEASNISEAINSRLFSEESVPAEWRVRLCEVTDLLHSMLVAERNAS